MKVITYATAADFWQAAGSLFTADPVRNTIAMTVLGRLLGGGRFSPAEPLFLTVETDDGHAAGAAFCTPPYPINVTTLPAEFAPLVADHLVSTGFAVSGVNGMRPEVEAFVAAWAERTGATLAGHMNQRFYRLDRFVPPTGIEGQAAPATDADVELLVDWTIAFQAEAHELPGDGRSRDERAAQHRHSIAAGNTHMLWRVDGVPVSLAAVGAPHAGVSKVGPVYTPKEFRSHGYGSAATAAATRWALDHGADDVVLFTDLGNPVSNSIYQRLGFVPVGEALDVTFAPVRLP